MLKVAVEIICFLQVGNIIHETGHAVGFRHEHTRPIRDSYVQIQPSNIMPEELINFYAEDEFRVSTLEVPYDYGSIMHYTGNVIIFIHFSCSLSNLQRKRLNREGFSG